MYTVAIVGKPNVGKSTLFNRMIKKNKAIIDSSPGVTRDRIYCETEWLTQKFMLIDTGGLMLDDFVFKKQIEIQVATAIQEADLILFLVSCKDGINNDDFYVAKKLKKSKDKKIILVANKAENNQQEDYHFFNLGFGKPHFISAEHGIGIGDLLDLIIQKKQKETKQENDYYPFCVIGKPNVGKSSLVNAILNQERVIVSEIAGTTRDAIDTHFKRNSKYYTIIDTAGIKRKGKISLDVDKYAFLRVEQSISRSSLILIVLDGKDGFKEQDESIAGLVFKANIPSIIVVNKWDVVDKDETTMNKITKEIKTKFKFLFWSPIVFLSAKNNQRIDTLFDEIEKIRNNVTKKISSSILTDVIMKAQMLNNPPSFKGGRLKVNYATQVNGQIPTFVLFCNNPQFLHFSYARYLENEIRKNFDFNNVPITLYFKPKNSNIRNKEILN